ncbi:hypothetical protein [Larkinella terrae]|uniref:Uncharacterized protein n=1 Tax=Larkinella terrae TaxID=2025311 RepID=A0A7K0EIW9_9BACT|nr:hypothetical protein [Larkinella terrae]MRS61734.1 hypothetical protein [Larkinella terrae]
MELSEKDLEDSIYNAAIDSYGRLFLEERGLTLNGKIFRQVNLGDYGIADLITIHYIGKKKNIHNPDGKPIKTILITVYELKKGLVGLATYGQLHRYMRGVQELAKTTRANKSGGVDIQVWINGTLIGDGIESIDAWDLITSSPGMSAYIYKFGFDGLSFIQIERDHMPTRAINEDIIKSVDFKAREFISTRSIGEYIDFLKKK